VEKLLRKKHSVTIIFITADCEEALRPRVIERGNVECLFKPFSDTTPVEVIQAGLGTR